MKPIHHSIGERTSLQEARQIMRDQSIRHLAVLGIKGTAVGILSDRDIKLACSFPSAKDFLVGDIMTPDPYVVQIDRRLDEVVLEMNSHKYGAVLVTDDLGRVMGVFTTTDALKVLNDYIQRDEIDLAI